MKEFHPLVTPLFVPATRRDFLLKAARTNADAVIVDLEDAVPPADKDSAREGLEGLIADFPIPVFIRINAIGTTWFADDLALVKRSGVDGVVLPKTQSQEDLLAIGNDVHVIGLIETALGIVSLPEICKASNLRQLAFGTIDYALDTASHEKREALLLARLSIVTQSRAHNLPCPLDGVCTSIDNEEIIRSDTEYAAALGFAGKLAIHPRQLPVIREALRPSATDLKWAAAACAIFHENAGAAVLLEGRMIDAPVAARARQMLKLAEVL